MEPLLAAKLGIFTNISINEDCNMTFFKTRTQLLLEGCNFMPLRHIVALKFSFLLLQLSYLRLQIFHVFTNWKLQ